MSTAGGRPHVVFSGGGTGGHLFPGLAVATRLAQLVPGVRITFAGCGKPLEQEHVAAAGFDYLALRCRPMPRRLRDVIPFVRENLAGCDMAGQFLAEHGVSAVIGLGGYASVPMARAGLRRAIPLVLLEQNVVPGRATRWLARGAMAVCTAFPRTEKYLPARTPVRRTGNPIRPGFQPALSPRRQLVILGGSSGSRALNDHVPDALYQVREALAGWTIVHQSGHTDWHAVHERYARYALDVEVHSFVVDMPGTLSRSALAICRAGGTTLAELAAAGTPAILVPYPHAAGNHQRLNADYFAAAGAAVVIDQRGRCGTLAERLAEALAELLPNAARRESMSRNSLRLAAPEAATAVAALVRDVLATRFPSGSFSAP